jgi:tetratricopeptide (TPR) repeat protein
MLVIAHLQRDDYDAAQRLVTQCLAQAQARGLQRIEASCMNLLAVLAQTKLDPVATLEWHEKDLALRRQIGDWRGQALSLCNVGSAWLSLGEPVRARRCCEEALRLVRALGNRLGECGTLCALSELERWLGNGPQALAHAQQALAAAVAIGMPRWEALAVQRLGDAQLLLGQPAAAALTFEKKLAMDLHRDSVLGGSLAGLARSAQACGDLPLAMQHVERLLALDASTNDVNRNAAPRRVELVCHLVLSSAGDPRADTWLRRAHGGLMELAANISDESLREGYLNNIPDHRAILAAWALHEQERAG